MNNCARYFTGWRFVFSCKKWTARQGSSKRNKNDMYSKPPKLAPRHYGAIGHIPRNSFLQNWRIKKDASHTKRVRFRNSKKYYVTNGSATNRPSSNRNTIFKLFLVFERNAPIRTCRIQKESLGLLSGIGASPISLSAYSTCACSLPSEPLTVAGNFPHNGGKK